MGHYDSCYEADEQIQRDRLKQIKEDRVFKKPEIEINLLREGWDIWVGNKYYHYDTSSDDNGTRALQVLFTDLGFEVDLKETY